MGGTTEEDSHMMEVANTIGLDHLSIQSGFLLLPFSTGQ